MEEYLNKGIKKIIDDYPDVGSILDEYQIGCSPCGVGTCLLKDIVEIHNLPIEDEIELMNRIAKAIYPDRDIKIPRIKRKAPTSGEIKYSPPLKQLVNEHKNIKKILSLIPDFTTKIDLESKEGIELILKIVNFIQNYADKYHHAKEEDLLFKYFDPNLDILKVIYEDHETGRAHVRDILVGVENKNKNMVVEHLTGYKDLLQEHIKKEDEILYPWMDRNLNTSQVGELFSKYSEVDKRFEGTSIKYLKFIKVMEEKFLKKNKGEI